MWEAIRSNLYFFAAALLISVVFIVYMLAAHGSSSAVQFVGLAMAMGNTYGVLLIICLLGARLLDCAAPTVTITLFLIVMYLSLKLKLKLNKLHCTDSS
jgi:hypothetical protein